MQPDAGLAPKADMDLGWFQADGRVIGLLGAIGRPGRGFGFEAADIMAARVRELRRLDRLPRAFAVRPALSSDEAALGSLTGDPAKARRLLASGDIGLLAIAGGAVQAMEWVRLGPSQYDWDARRLGVVFGVPPRCCWLHNGQDGEAGAVGPWAMILGRLPGFLDERGIEAAFLQVGCENPYSRRCHESLGFRNRGRIVTLHFGRWRLTAVRLEGGWWARVPGGAVDLQQVSP
jgi:hypothetical protein